VVGDGAGSSDAGGTAAAGGAGGAAAAAGGPKPGPRALWQRAIERQIEVNRAQRTPGGGALETLVGGMLRRGDVEATRWCSTLLLLQQIGVGLERLQDCMGGPRRGGRGAA
jgi:hypothetical protein